MLSNLNPIYYVQIWENRIKVTDVGTGNTFDDVPLVSIGEGKAGKKIITAIGREANQKIGDEIVNPFSHPRTLLKDFIVAEKLLHHALQIVNGKSSFSFAPTVVIHPIGKDEGGFTQIERRAFRELVLGAGGRKVFLHLGKNLDLTNLDLNEVRSAELDEDYNNSQEDLETTTITKIMTGIVFVVMGYSLFLAFSGV